MRAIITSFLALYLTTVPVWGAVADQSTGRIVVHHNDGTVDIQDGAAELISRNQLRTGLAYRIRPSETIEVIIDGASGAEFLKTLRQYIEQPLRLVM